MALRKVVITREAIEHMTAGHAPICGGLRVVEHIGQGLEENGIKGMAVMSFEKDRLTIVGDNAKGFDLRTARVYAENWERIFAPK